MLQTLFLFSLHVKGLIYPVAWMPQRKVVRNFVKRGVMAPGSARRLLVDSVSNLSSKGRFLDIFNLGVLCHFLRRVCGAFIFHYLG